MLRASFVLFSVTYSYAVLAYAMYCSTPLGTLPIEGVADHSMMKRWVVDEAWLGLFSLAGCPSPPPNLITYHVVVLLRFKSI